MSTADAERGQVAPEAALVYEEYFVPALFAQWTDRMLDAVGCGPGDRLLDVGTGTGVLARRAARCVGPRGEVTAVDVNAGMLAVARQSPEPVRWLTHDAHRLPFADSTFDRATSQFVFMFLDDPPRAAAEMWRVVRPGGRVAAATWARIEESPGYAAMSRLLSRVVGPDAAAALSAPFRLGTTDVLHDLLSEAWPGLTVTRHEGEARFDSVAEWMHTDIRGWTLAGMVDDATFETLLAEAESALAEFVDPGGRVRFPAPALIASAARPATH